MKSRTTKIVIYLSLCGLVSSCLRDRVEFSDPTIDERIIDNAELFSDSERDSLFNIIKELDKAVGSQIGIVTIDSLEKGETIEHCALRKVDEMRLGRRNYRDGLLFLVSKREECIRIEVGNGLVRIISSEKAKWINTNLIGPYFSNGFYYHGVFKGVSYASALIKNNRDQVGGPHL